MSEQNSRSRIVFDIDPELRARLVDKVAWGEIRSLYTPLTEQLVELLEAHDPELVKAGIVSKSISLSQIIDYNKNSKGGK